MTLCRDSGTFLPETETRLGLWLTTAGAKALGSKHSYRRAQTQQTAKNEGSSVFKLLIALMTTISVNIRDAVAAKPPVPSCLHNTKLHSQETWGKQKVREHLEAEQCMAEPPSAGTYGRKEIQCWGTKGPDEKS